MTKVRKVRESSSLCPVHRRTGNFLSGGAVNHLPKKNSRKLPKFLRNSRKETRAIRCNNVGHTGTEGGSML